MPIYPIQGVYKNVYWVYLGVVRHPMTTDSAKRNRQKKTNYRQH